MASPTTTTPTPVSGKRTIKRKLDESILKKARVALGLPLESHDDEDKNEEPSLKWRKPRHNTAEGQAYIKNKQKRKMEEEQSQGLIKIAKDAKEKSKLDKKKGKKKRKKKAKNQPQQESVEQHKKDPDGEKRHGMEAIAYLQLWESNRDHWKFEKRKQTWLLKNCLNSDLIDDKRFETLVEYIGTVKGSARQTTMTEMQSLVTKYEMIGGEGSSPVKDSENPESSSKNSITVSMYDRARQIIQVLTDE